MTYTSDQYLAALGLRRLADLPIRDGVTITLRTRDGADVPATVRKHEFADTYYCDRTGGHLWSDFIGWRPRVDPADIGNTLIRYAPSGDIVAVHLNACARRAGK